MLKELLGDKFKDGMTVEEIETALAGRKIVDLNGETKYVLKEKFDKLSEKVAQYDNENIDAIKAERDQLKTASLLAKDRTLFGTAKVGEKFYDDISYRLEKGTIKRGATDEETKTNITAFLKDNPQYATVEGPKAPVLFSTRNATEQQTSKNGVEDNSAINAIIRGAAVK